MIDKYLLICLISVLFSCSENSREIKNNSTPIDVKNKLQANKNELQIAIQPFDDFPHQRAEFIFNSIKNIYSNTVLLTSIALPSKAFYPSRNRYRADTIIDWLSERANTNQVITGLTTKDISSTKDNYIDWGVMGLGQCPGNSCVISSSRLKNLSNEQLFKVVIHELGHTQGLEHCLVKSCFMRDAEGHNTTDEEIDFCPSCKKVLLSKGWKL